MVYRWCQRMTLSGTLQYMPPKKPRDLWWILALITYPKFLQWALLRRPNCQSISLCLPRVLVEVCVMMLTKLHCNNFTSWLLHCAERWGAVLLVYGKELTLLARLLACLSMSEAACFRHTHINTWIDGFTSSALSKVWSMYVQAVWIEL